MSDDNVVHFPPSWTKEEYVKTPGPETFEVRYQLRARNSKDWSMIKETFDDESAAAECARRLYKAGYDVSCDKHHVYELVRWTHEENHTEGDEP